MTTLAFLADIHGNLPALEAVMADMAQFAPDHVIVAGDMVNGAPFSVEVLETIFQKRWTAIRGNHEFYVLDHLQPQEHPERRASKNIQYLYKILQDWMPILRAMPDDLTLYYPDAPPIRVTHGLPGKNNKAVTLFSTPDDIREKLHGVHETVFIAGHYHIGFEHRVDHWHVLNPGPVGNPQDGNNDAGYLILRAENGIWQPTFRRVPYDVEYIRDYIIENRLIEQAGTGMMMSYLQIKYARPIINAFVDWRDHHHPNSTQFEVPLIKEFIADPDAMWKYFGKKYHVNRELFTPIPLSEVEQFLS